MHFQSSCRLENTCTVSGGTFVGAFIGFFCPLCVPATASLLSAIGLSFLPHPQYIYPLVGILSVILLIGLVMGFRKHGEISPLLFGAIGVFMVPVGRYIIGSAMLTYTGAFIIIGATLCNTIMQYSPAPNRYINEKKFKAMLNEVSA